MGRRPGARRILGRDDEIAAVAEVAVYNVESPVVITNRGGHDSAVARILFNIKAVLRRQHIAQLLPVDQIPAVEKRDPGAQFETGAHEVVIVSHSADRRIRIKARNDWIFNHIFHCLPLLCSAQASKTQNLTVISAASASTEFVPAKILKRPSSKRYFPVLS